jgi:SpoU rRNA methylase family enzyme
MTDITRADKRRLLAALNSVPNLLNYEFKAACILLAVNGIDNALEYVDGIKHARLRAGDGDNYVQAGLWEGATP